MFNVHRAWVAYPELGRGIRPNLIGWICLSWVLSVVCGQALAAHDPRLAEHARRLDRELKERFAPYWYDTTLDEARGGYLLADDLRGRGEAKDKQLVSQARMVWAFSHFRLNGVRDPKRNYVKAAKSGYDFLIAKFQDPTHGGYFWRTDLEGQTVSDRKVLYGQAFVVYALIEYYRASGDKEALRHAEELYETIQERCHDRKNGGWIEHFERDWKPITQHDASVEVEVGGLKSANTHLHWMEALTELYDVTRRLDVRRSLEEALKINQKYFYPKQPGKSAFHRQPNWKEVRDPKSAGLSYGHNVEFAWLMIRAERVLSQSLSWDHFNAHVDHALKYGYDHERGGLYNRGFGDQPATDTNKVWWVQAEMLAALTDAILHETNPAHEKALIQLLEFTEKYQADPKDGIWLDTVTAEGQPKSTGKAHSWKAAYHDGRAFVKFLDAFRPRP